MEFKVPVPESFKMAMASKESEQWKRACLHEINLLKSLQVYQLVNTPLDRKQIDTCWVFRVKEDEKVNLIKYKARWVVKGYMKAHGVDYELNHVHVSSMSTLRILLSLAVKRNLKVNKMEVSTAFLNAVLDDEVYVKPPPSFEHFIPRGKSIKFLKALYGLKQSSRAWNLLLDGFLKNHAVMSETIAYRCLYTRYLEGKLDLVIILYVYYILIMASNPNILT